MLNEKYAQMMSVCEEMAKTSDDAQITEQFAHTRQLLETEHTPTVALIGLGPVGRSLLDAAGEICGTEVPSTLDQSFANGPTCLTLEDGEEEALYRIAAEGCIQIADAGIPAADNCSVDELVCGFPCGRLRNTRMILCGGVTNYENWVQLMENMDVVALRVNATAAMNQVERQWIDNTLLPLFGKTHGAIWLDLLDQLNTEEDRQTVVETVKKTLAKRDLEIPVFSTAKEVGEWMFAELADMNVRDQFIRKALRISLHMADNRITQIRQIGSVDEQAVSKAVRALESQRKQMELAGEIAADTTVINTYTKLKLDAKAGVRDFNAQAVDSICQKIADAPYDELETLEPKIQAYLRKVWERYQQEMNARMNEETAKCYASVMERMEMDAGKMIADMDEETQEILREAISRPVAEQGGTLVRPDWEYQGTNSLTKLKVETRNMMLLAIPLAFFAHPVLAVATFFGAKYYCKSQSEKRGEEFRNALKEQVRTSCNDVLEDVLREVDRSFDEAAAQTAAIVRDAYKELIDKLIEQLNQLAQRQHALAGRVEALNHMQTVTIPSLDCSL